MSENILVGLAAIIILGISAQLIAWRTRFPSILLLLIFGFVAGPILKLINPDELFGDLLFPIISISVAVILFEGGLSLRFKDIPGLRAFIFNLITIGVIVTWIVAALSAYYLLDLDFGLSILLGAVLTVSGPTVIIPMLRHVKPKEPLGAVLKWEGILIDPVGAILAVLVFEILYHGQLSGSSTSLLLGGMAYTLAIGLILGFIFAFILAKVIKAYLVPDFLQNPFALSLVILAYVLSNHFQPESGLLTVTVMGVVLANSKDITVQHLLEFKENLRVLLISSLFIILAARLELEQVLSLDIQGCLIFLALLIFLARPLSVAFSSIGSGLKFKEKLFISAIAPRGIVAAAVSSLFALQLASINYPQAELLGAVTFFVIIGTVIIYGLSAKPLAKALELDQSEPNGIVMLGANTIAVQIAESLKSHNIKTLLVDTNPRNVYIALKSGLNALHSDVLGAFEEKKLELDGIGMLLALTPNNEANSLAALRFQEEFGRSRVFQLPAADSDIVSSELPPHHLRGRILFNSEANYYKLDDLLNDGAQIHTISIEDDLGFDNLFKKYDRDFIPLFYISPNGRLEVAAIDNNTKPKKGWTVVCIVKDDSLSNE